MSVGARIFYLILAICTMLCLALGSISMAQGHGWLATLFFVLFFVVAGVGFVAKRRIMRPQPQ